VWDGHDGGGEGVRRWAFNVAAAVSVVLGLATLALWAASYRWEFQIDAKPPPHDARSGVRRVCRGAVEAVITAGVDDMRPPGGWEFGYWCDADLTDDDFALNWLGRMWFHQSRVWERGVLVLCQSSIDG
jgi:hypothetical protein